MGIDLVVDSVTGLALLDDPKIDQVFEFSLGRV
jgi:hypothetical protein